MIDTALFSRPTNRETLWDIALLFPKQGEFTEGDYLQLSELTNKFVEFANGQIEIPPMPDIVHQRLTAFIYQLLAAFCTTKDLGEVFFAPLPVRLGENHFREPDVVVVLKQHRSRFKKTFVEGADLVVEVVSESGSHRDVVQKRAEYAIAGITEYWIIDPRAEVLTVLSLEAGETNYRVFGNFVRNTKATSKLLEGFAIDIDQMLTHGHALD